MRRNSAALRGRYPMPERLGCSGHTHCRNWNSADVRRRHRFASGQICVRTARLHVLDRQSEAGRLPVRGDIRKRNKNKSLLIHSRMGRIQFFESTSLSQIMRQLMPISERGTIGHYPLIIRQNIHVVSPSPSPAAAFPFEMFLTGRKRVKRTGLFKLVFWRAAALT